MKKLVIILLQILFIIPVVAQDKEDEDDDQKTNIKNTRQGFGVNRGIDLSLGFVNARMRTEGSAYYFDDWNNEGSIIIKDQGMVKIKKININLYNNKLEALYDENNVFTFDSKNVIRIVINGKIFRTFEFENQPKIFELFYSGKISVYRYFNVSYAEGSANPMVNRKTNKYIQNKRYYLYKDGELTRMKMTKKGLSKMLQTDTTSQDDISEFIKQNRLSLNKEPDLIQLLKYVNRVTN